MVRDIGDWRLPDSAPRDGSLILIVFRSAEQGPGAIDVARWGRPHRSAEERWIAADSDPECEVVYADVEVRYWLPLPSDAPTQRDAILASALPAPPNLNEDDGSGI